MTLKLKYYAATVTESILNSYSQVFFSKKKAFALLLLIVTFFDPFAGLSGLTAVATSNFLAYIIGFNRLKIKSGYYGFNSLLVGLGLGVYYQPGAQFFLILGLASLFTLFLTLAFEGVLGKYGLPFLSIPFLLSIWIVSLSAREFTGLSISERGIYFLNELYALGGTKAVSVYIWLDNLHLPQAWIVYFRSLGAVFFQYHLVPGVIIALGLLLASRIAFILSLLGFFSAWWFYQYIGADIRELSYAYIGFNFILTSIAIGGFFIVPSVVSYLAVILLVPVTSFILSGNQLLFGMFQLSVYSLPFNIVVLLFLYILKFRERNYLRPELVTVQYFSPEENLYSHKNHKQRMLSAFYLPVSLPFMGKWTVTQGHNGNITHKESWRHAWDFELADDEGRFYINQGNQPEDFLCYNKPVLAPADGTVEQILDGVDDNPIGTVNLQENWGNVIIIKHAPGLYSKLCHLKKGSFKVKKGDWVRKGDIVACCGNSGRSPKPHLHFQLQQNPFIGSATLDFPLSGYIVNDKNKYYFMQMHKPLENQVVCNIENNKYLQQALSFVPGQKLQFEVEKGKKKYKEEWLVEMDLYNNVYIKELNTNSIAYFQTSGEIRYFTSFQGSRKTLLFLFYQAAYKTISGFYKYVEMFDKFSMSHFRLAWISWLHDCIAPFYSFIKVDYHSYYVKGKEYFNKADFVIESDVVVSILGFKIKKTEFVLEINEKGLYKIICKSHRKKITGTGLQE